MTTERSRVAGEIERRALLHEVNTRIREINDRFGTDLATYDLFCECGHERCLERVQVPAQVYDELRGDTGRVVVARGHRRDHEDRVVSAGSGYEVVAPEPPARLALPAPAFGVAAAAAGPLPGPQ